jgi:hypothetical protein
LKFSITLNQVQTLNDIPEYWSNADYINLLEELEFSDTSDSDRSELFDLLSMAISDFEPHEAAEILLRYKLKEVLSDGQIKNLSHQMTDDNEAEDNSDIALHYTLFNINQLLHKAFNGTFPNAKATKITFQLSFKDDPKISISKELCLKAVCALLTENSPISRLFEDQLNGKEPFGDAEKLVWELHDSIDKRYTMITSDYWINKEDFIESEFSGSMKLYKSQKE